MIRIVWASPRVEPGTIELQNQRYTTLQSRQTHTTYTHTHTQTYTHANAHTPAIAISENATRCSSPNTACHSCCKSITNSVHYWLTTLEALIATLAMTPPTALLHQPMTPPTALFTMVNQFICSSPIELTGFTYAIRASESGWPRASGQFDTQRKSTLLTKLRISPQRFVLNSYQSRNDNNEQNMTMISLNR